MQMYVFHQPCLRVPLQIQFVIFIQSFLEHYLVNSIPDGGPHQVLINDANLFFFRNCKYILNLSKLFGSNIFQTFE